MLQLPAASVRWTECGRAPSASIPRNGDELGDAGLLASAQKLEHYEIAAYGSAAALAGQLDLRNDQKLLHANLEEEKRMDEVLTRLAKGEVNPDAVAA